MTARTLMVQGTASGAGKSILTAALCRIYARRGLRVLPFKAQNMSNNAAVTPCGGEIGRAQALQARACGVEPRPEMNPVLLKPVADDRSDVIVLGRRDAALTALPWRQRSGLLGDVVREALRAVRAEADLVVIEGAGSPAEVNLPDLVNMGTARMADAPVLVVADIDRGGAFAALFGTWALLPEGDRARIRGFVLNRFRGDASLLAPAPTLLSARTGVPVLGVVPFLRLDLPDEDAASLGDRGRGETTIAAVRLLRVSNFDDLDPLAAVPGVRVRWIDSPDGLEGCAAVVLPGSRNTTGDLRWLWETGLAAAIRARAAAGLPVAGLCGGYQMLGRAVRDPLHLEGGGEVPGLALLDGETTLAEEKTTRRVEATVSATDGAFSPLAGTTVRGYEIHHGETRPGAGETPLLSVDGHVAGTMRGNVWGGYLHGIFANDAFRTAWLASLTPGDGDDGARLRWDAHLDAELDRLADAVESALEMHEIDRIVGLAPAGASR